MIATSHYQTLDFYNSLAHFDNDYAMNASIYIKSPSTTFSFIRLDTVACLHKISDPKNQKTDCLALSHVQSGAAFFINLQYTQLSRERTTGHIHFF